MNDNDSNHKQPQFEHELPLPGSSASVPANSDQTNQAVDSIRQKVQSVYADEPDAEIEVSDLSQLDGSLSKSKHQQFIYDLTNSGKSLPEIQAAWHSYYAGLSDVEKHQVWQEFYSSHAQASNFTPGQSLAPQAAEQSLPALKSRAVTKTVADLKQSLITISSRRQKMKSRPASPLQSLFFGLGIGLVVVTIFMFSFFNERFIAPFIQPSRNITDAPIIAGNTASGTDPEIIIPKINVEIPVIYGVGSIAEKDLQKALEGGVVHYADTAQPGQDGNVVIVGHSSNNVFNRGKYKFAFVLLSRLENKDTFYLDKAGVRYTYEVFEKKIVKPTDVSVLGTHSQPATVTLITCDPPGTSTNRLVVVGKQISPNPSGNSPQIAQNSLATRAPVVPGNAPSLWSRLFSWL